MPRSSGTSAPALFELVADVVGKIIARERQSWKREQDLASAEQRLLFAELKNELMECRARLQETGDAQIRRIEAIIAGIKDGADGRDGRDADPAEVDAIVDRKLAQLPPPETPITRDQIVEIATEISARAERALTAAIPIGTFARGVDEAVREAVAALPAPDLPTRAELSATIAGLVTEAVESLPAPERGEAGQDADPAEVERLVKFHVNNAVSMLPAPKDGESVDRDAVRQMVADEVAQLPAPKGFDLVDATPAIDRAVDAAVKALPAPAEAHLVRHDEMPAIVEAAVCAALDARPAPQIPDLPTRDELDELIAELVAAECAALPKPKDGDPGRDADPEEIRRVVSDAVDEAVRALPKAKDGQDGAPGKFPPVREWYRGIHYEGAVLTHHGSTYCARRDTAEPPPHDDWIVIAAAAPEPYVGEVCGLYDPDREYRKFDLVVLNGAEWRAKVDDPGKLPGDGWALSATQGKPGKPGPKGDPGPRGVAAIAEPPPRIKSWQMRDYEVAPVMTDGTTAPGLDLRPLFERYHDEAAR